MTAAAFPSPPPVNSSTGQQPPPLPGPSPRPELRRSGSDRMIGGVCGGLAEYSGIDALLWRAGLVVLTLAGGSGVLLYLVLWVLMPAGPRRPDERPGPVEGLVERLHTAVAGTRSTS